MTEIVIPYRPHVGQRQFHNDRARFRVLACGRRWGKTTAAVAETIRAAVQQPRAMVWWVAPTYALANLGWREMGVLLPSALVADLSLSERRIVLSNGAEIWIKSAENITGLRGAGIDLVVIDEAAFVREEAWTNALRPALSDRQGRAVFISTPLGRNWFYALFVRGEEQGDQEWHSLRYRTADNPLISPAEIEAARRDMPERTFRQEFEAEFIEDAGAVFRRVAAAAVATPAGAGEDTVWGVDWGKHNDFTVITVLDGNGTMLSFDRFNEVDYVLQLARLRAMAERFRPRIIVAEANAMGEPLVEQLRREGLPVIGFTTTAATKARLIEALALSFERGEIKILPERVLINELQAFEVNLSSSGAARYAAPSGLHDDCVISLALAWYAVAGIVAGPAILEI